MRTSTAASVCIEPAEPTFLTAAAVLADRSHSPVNKDNKNFHTRDLPILLSIMTRVRFFFVTDPLFFFLLLTSIFHLQPTSWRHKHATVLLTTLSLISLSQLAERARDQQPAGSDVHRFRPQPDKGPREQGTRFSGLLRGWNRTGGAQNRGN